MTTYQLPRLRLGRLSDAAVCMYTRLNIPEVLPTSGERFAANAFGYSNSVTIRASYLCSFRTFILLLHSCDLVKKYELLLRKLLPDTCKIFATTRTREIICKSRTLSLYIIVRSICILRIRRASNGLHCENFNKHAQ